MIAVRKLVFRISRGLLRSWITKRDEAEISALAEVASIRGLFNFDISVCVWMFVSMSRRCE